MNPVDTKQIEQLVYQLAAEESDAERAYEAVEKLAKSQDAFRAAKCSLSAQRRGLMSMGKA